MLLQGAASHLAQLFSCVDAAIAQDKVKVMKGRPFLSAVTYIKERGQMRMRSSVSFFYDLQFPFWDTASVLHRKTKTHIQKPFQTFPTSPRNKWADQHAE